MGPFNLLGSDKDAPSKIWGYLGGIGNAILGRSQRFAVSDTFHPLNRKEYIIDITQKDLFRIAHEVPHLNIVISKGAEIFSNMRLIHKDEKGVEIENSPVTKFLQKPNPLQTFRKLMYQFYINNAIYGTAFFYKNYGSRIADLPSTLWCLPSGLMTVKTTGKIYRQYKVEQIIDHYEMSGDDIFYKPDEIILITDGISDNLIQGESKIFALQMPLSNIMSALKSNNIILNDRGPIGFITTDINDTSGLAQPLTDKEREYLEAKLNRDYSLDSKRGHVAMTKAALKWVPMTFDVKQLMLYEGMEDSFGLICGKYGIDRYCFPAVDGTAYENKDIGWKRTIETSAQPLGDILADQFTYDLITQKNLKGSLHASWEHMPMMKEDKVQAETAKKLRAETTTIHMNNGVMSPEAYADENEIDFTGTGETMQEKLSKQANNDKNNGNGKDRK